MNRFDAWHAWRQETSASHPEWHAWRGDLERLATLIRGAVVTGLVLSDDEGQVVGDGHRRLSFSLTLRSGKQIALHVGISRPACDGALGPAFTLAHTTREDMIYDNDLGLEITTFDHGGVDDPDAPNFWDSQEWRTIPGYDRDFHERTPEEEA